MRSFELRWVNVGEAAVPSPIRNDTIEDLDFGHGSLAHMDETEY